MMCRWYYTEVQREASELAKTVLAAASPPQIASACTKVEAFLQKHPSEHAPGFFSITFPTLLRKIFGFDESASASKPQSHSGWIDTATLSGDVELSDKIFSLLSPNGILLSSMSAVDGHNLVKCIFPNERLPEWVRLMLLKGDCQALAGLCPLFKNRVKKDPARGLPLQVQLNVFECYMFWFAYYPVYKGSSEGSEAVKVQRSNKFSLENWAYSIPRLSSGKRGMEQKNEGNLYIRLLYAYLRTFVPIYESNAHQPYHSSLLYHPQGNDISVIKRAEFLVNVAIQFWLVDNDFSPLPLSVCKLYCSVLGETQPISSLGEVINVFVKYLTLSSVVLVGGYDRFESARHPYQKLPGSIDVVKPRNAALNLRYIDSWSSWMRRPLYRFILRTFLFCPVETSMKNVSQVFNLWVNYMEPWKISLKEFTELDAIIDMPCKDRLKEVTPTPSEGYSSSWQWFVLANYLYYSSLVMHFFGFAHKFLHKDPEGMVQMVSKVINILTSSTELMNVIKNVDTAFHSKPTGSSKSLLNALYRFVPTIREELQDWEDGLCNWNKDLGLFSEGEDGGQQLLHLFVFRAKSELQAIDGDNAQRDFLKAQICKLYGGPLMKSSPSMTEPRDSQQSMTEPRDSQQTPDELFCPRSFANQRVADIKYKGDWMLRPITSDEIAWLAKLLINLSIWLNAILGLNQVEDNQDGLSKLLVNLSVSLNEILGLNQVEYSQDGPSSSHADISGETGELFGTSDTMKMVFYSLLSWLITLAGAGIKFMRKHGMRVNLRILASKKVVAVLFIYFAFRMLRRAFV